MATKVGDVYVDISARDDKLAAELDKAQKKVAASMKKIGRNIAIAGAVITGAFAMAIKTAAQFEQSMALTASVTNATAEELKRLSDYARKMGEQSVFSASQAADAMYFLGSAGMEAEEVMGALEGTLALAAATASDLAYTSESVAATLSQFALDAEEAGRVANVFAAAISASQATMDKLSTSMSYVGPMAKSMGMTLEDTVGILMNLYNAGLDGSMAGTALRMAFVKLIEPTEAGAIALKGLEIAIKDSKGEMRPFKDIIDDLGIAGMSTADAMAIFGVRAGPAMMALVSQGTGSIQEMTDAVTGTNKATEMAEMQIDTFQGAIKLLQSAFEELQITLVQDLMPAIKGLIEDVTEGIKKVSDWMKENPKLTETIVKWTAAIGALMLILGPLLMILPGLVTGIVLVKGAILKLNPIVLLITANIIIWYNVIKEIDKVLHSVHTTIEDVEQAENILAEVQAKLAEKLGITVEELKEFQKVGASVSEMMGIELIPATEELLKTFEDFLGEVERVAKETGELDKRLSEMRDIMQPAIEAIQKIIDTMTPYEKQLATINKRYDEAIEKISTYIKGEEELKSAIDKLNEGRKAEIILLDRQKTALEKLLEAKQKLIDATKIMTDRIFELTHTARELAIKKLDEEKQAYLDLGKSQEEVIKWYKLEMKALDKLYPKKKRDVDIIKEMGKEAKETAKHIQFLGTRSVIAFGYIKEAVDKARVSLHDFTIEGVAAAITAIKMHYFPEISRLQESIRDLFVGAGPRGLTEWYEADLERVLKSMQREMDAIMYGFKTYGETLAGLGGAIPAYPHGTPYVSQTGLAVVHKGEAIIPASQNTYDQRKSYSSSINIQPGAIIINTPRFSGRDAKEMLAKIKREAAMQGYKFATA